MANSAIEHLFSLPAADRRAIMRRLTPGERAALKAAFAKRLEVRKPPPAPLVDLRAYSPWLRRHIERALSETPAVTQTPAAQAALRQLVLKSAP